MHTKQNYLFGELDGGAWEIDFPGYGRTFPHAYGDRSNRYFTTLLTISPAGDELTLDFSMELVKREGLGQDETPDFLGISFSSTDYVGHFFGPSSLEAEDNMLRLDRTLARLFTFIDEHIGLDKTLIVVSADHGAPDAVGYLNSMGMTEARYFDPDAMDKQPAIERLKQRFGVGGELVTQYFHPYFYLNRALIEELGLDQKAVEQAVAAEVMKLNGISLAISSRALADNELVATPIMQSVLNNFNRKRSGDIYVVFEPNVYINDLESLVVASMHGSPWKYDSHVPIFFAGHGSKPQRVDRAVTPYDIAATLAAYIGTNPPSSSVGVPLEEVLKR
jgi:predicted AlkP superfamily pyrophosphatase or phosphodiesterase